MSASTKENVVRYYLLYFSIVWVVYSAFVWVRLDWLSVLSGLEFNNWSAIVEGRAMYGGFELGLAIFAFLGFKYPDQYLRANVVMWALGNLGFSIGRIHGILTTEGSTFIIHWGVTPDSWNPGALWMLELPSALLFSWYWLTTYKGNTKHRYYDED